MTKQTKPAYKTMSIACCSGTIGMVMFINDHLVLMKLSSKGSKSPEQARTLIKKWFERFQPDCVVTEQLTSHSRKHGKTPDIIKAISNELQEHTVLHIEVERQQQFKNKHEEAKALVEQYPQLKSYLPNKRQIWLAEDRRMMLFEAVANVEQNLK